jgi:protein-tyrosine kinase
MSRIHEALKRAEQEREASHAFSKPELAGSNGAVQAVEAEVIPPRGTHSIPALMPEERQEIPSQALRFEDLAAKSARPQWKPDPKTVVFCNSNAFVHGAEQFRTLRSRLYRIRESQALKTVLITSAIPGEGKSLVATNLAYAIARQHGTRVLLVDADLRAPRTHTLLGAPATPGLTDYLQGRASETDVIQRGPEEGFCFVPSGSPATHPSELISSNGLKKFLERIKPMFDWIIIDSPPAVSVSDAAVLGPLCDGVLFVVRAGSTPSDLAQKAARELSGAHILGVVLNGVKRAAGYGEYYSYGASKEKPSNQ